MYIFFSLGNLNIVSKILAVGGVDVNIKTSKTNDSAITVAAHLGNADIVKLLLENGADIETKNKMGWTPLLAAVDGKYVIYGDV